MKIKSSICCCFFFSNVVIVLSNTFFFSVVVTVAAAVSGEGFINLNPSSARIELFTIDSGSTCCAIYGLVMSFV